MDVGRIRDRGLLIVCTLVFVGTAVVSVGRVPSSAQSSPVVSPAVAKGATWRRRSLAPVALKTDSTQPARVKPFRLVVADGGKKAYVTLAGSAQSPGSEVAVIDLVTRKELERIRVGSQPFGVALHPSGRWLIVANRFSNFLTVIDTRSDKVVGEIPAPFYCEDLVIDGSGGRAYVSNFWKNQVLVFDLEVSGDALGGRLHELGFDRESFAPPKGDGIHALLRARCGTAHCHLYASGGFVVGGDANEALASAAVHSFPAKPEHSPLLRAVVSVRHGGWADATNGYHHPGGVVFSDPAADPDYARLREWIASGREGPGISVGGNPRDLALSEDGSTLYVANAATLDVSVVDVATLRETRRIEVRAPVADLMMVDGRLVLASLGVGSGHPKARDAERESVERNGAKVELTIFRDVATGKPLPLSQQRPAGPFDDVDGTAQERFRDITNDITILDPAAERVDSYQASEMFTRYTSDSFEALFGDAKGDVATELLSVVGALPAQIARSGQRIYVAMSGTFEVQEWRVDVGAEPVRRLLPGRVFATGLGPTDVAVSGSTLIVVNHLGESLSLIDLDSGESSALDLGRGAAAYPATEFERGELYVHSSVFSADGDESCVHCHYRETSDGKKWSVGAVASQDRHGEPRAGGSREVPDLRNLPAEVPMFLEGVLAVDDVLIPITEQTPLDDFVTPIPGGDFGSIRATKGEESALSKGAHAVWNPTGKKWKHPSASLADLVKRREHFVRQQSKKYLGGDYGLRDLQRFVGAYQAGASRLLPNPEDPDDPMVQRGRALFESSEVGCAGCHPAPGFTDKEHPRNTNKAFPRVVSARPRDVVHTIMGFHRVDTLSGYERPGSDAKGLIQERSDAFVAPSLRGLWARPERFLHHGAAISLREVLATPKHPALRPLRFSRAQAQRPEGFELGRNELNGIPDTHGGTSHLSVWEIECLRRYVLSIE